MKKIKKDQEKEAKALVVAEKAAAKEAKLAQKEAKKQEKAKKQEIVAETPAPSVEPGEKV